MRLDCPFYKGKMEKPCKTAFNKKKEKKTYITWEENDMESESDSENEVVNLGLMAKDCISDDEVTCSSCNNISFSYDELQDAFNELHKESMNLAKLVSNSKKIISNLEKEILRLNKELEDLKTEVTSLNSNNGRHECESCQKYQKEMNDLRNTLSNFTCGTKT